MEKEIKNWKNITYSIALRFLWDEEDRYEYRNLNDADYEITSWMFCNILFATKN